MKKTIPFFFFVLMFFQANSQSGNITNIAVQPRTDGSGMVDVFFDLIGEADSYNILIEGSFDGGDIYIPVPVAFLSGDVSGTSPGSRHLVWDGYGSFPNQYSLQAKLKIIASSETQNPFVTGPDGYVYILTTQFYLETQDLNQAVIDEFGADALVADWNDLKSHFSGSIAVFLDGIGIYSDSQSKAAFIKRNGQFIHSGSRHYVIRRFDGAVPGNWLVHDHIDNYTLCLGSWYNLNHRILAKYPLE